MGQTGQGRRGCRVHTSLQPALQGATNKGLKIHYAKLPKNIKFQMR